MTHCWLRLRRHDWIPMTAYADFYHNAFWDRCRRCGAETEKQIQYGDWG